MNKCLYFLGCQKDSKTRGFCIKHYSYYNRKTRRSGIFKWYDVEIMTANSFNLSKDQIDFLTVTDTRAGSLSQNSLAKNIKIMNINARGYQ